MLISHSEVGTGAELPAAVVAVRVLEVWILLGFTKTGRRLGARLFAALLLNTGRWLRRGKNSE